MNLAQMTEPTPNLRARAYCPVIKITVAFFLGIDSGGS
jgi:hypothetical protein